MPLIKKVKIVEYDVQDMYDLVNQVEHYPEFLNWCERAEILQRDQDQLTATLTMSAGGMQKSFTTHNRMQPGKMIEIRLVDGPFKHLEGFWRFDKLDDGGCKMCLDLEFEFSSSWLGMLLEPMFTQISNTLVDAFSQRAEQLYGKD